MAGIVESIESAGLPIWDSLQATVAYFIRSYDDSRSRLRDIANSFDRVGHLVQPLVELLGECRAVAGVP